MQGTFGYDFLFRGNLRNKKKMLDLWEIGSGRFSLYQPTVRLLSNSNNCFRSLFFKIEFDYVRDSKLKIWYFKI